MLDSVNCLASPINNVLMAKPAKMAYVQMDVQITKIAQASMYVFKASVLIPVQLEKLVDPIADVKQETRLNIVRVLLALLEYQLPSKDVFVFLIHALVNPVLRVTSVSKVTVCLAVVSMQIVLKENNVSMECA